MRKLVGRILRGINRLRIFVVLEQIFSYTDLVNCLEGLFWITVVHIVIL